MAAMRRALCAFHIPRTRMMRMPSTIASGGRTALLHPRRPMVRTRGASWGATARPVASCRPMRWFSVECTSAFKDIGEDSASNDWRTLWDKGEHEKALQQLQKRIDALEDASYEDAHERAVKLHRLYPNHPVPLYWCAESAIHCQLPRDGEAYCRKALLLLDDEKVVDNLAELVQDGDPDEYRKKLESSLCTHLVSILVNEWASTIQAGIHHRSVRPHAAERKQNPMHDIPSEISLFVARGVKANRRNPVLLLLHAQSYVIANRFRDAIEILEQLERIDDDFAPLYLKRGECHSMIGEVSPAIFYFSKFLEKQQSFVSKQTVVSDRARVQSSVADALLKRGICYERYGDTLGAQHDFDMVISMNDKQWWHQAMVHRARLRLKNDMAWEAVEDCTEVLKRFPTNLAALKCRAEAYEKVGWGKEAQQDMQAYKVAEREYMWRSV